MHEGDNVGGGIQQTHPEEGNGLRTEGLPVHEIAPTADALADEEAQHHHVQQGSHLDLLDLAEDADAQDCTQNTAIDGQAAFPDVEELVQMLAVVVPGEDAVIKSGAEDGEGGHPQHAVHQVIFLDAELAAALATVEHRQDQAEGNDHTVIIDGKRAHLQILGWIHGNAQGGEGNFRIHG